MEALGGRLEVFVYRVPGKKSRDGVKVLVLGADTTTA